MLPIAARSKRETRPASELILALQCGGSDGYSGKTDRCSDIGGAENGVNQKKC